MEKVFLFFPSLIQKAEGGDFLKIDSRVKRINSFLVVDTVDKKTLSGMIKSPQLSRAQVEVHISHTRHSF